MAHQVIWRQEMWPSGLHVMVVDDNSCYLGLMERLLLQCNYKVTTCGGVQEAVSLVMGSNPQGVDLIISDVFLPGDDGLFILKSLAFQLHFPVIMMSWSGEIGTMMKYIAYGACDFLIKPVRIKELRNIWQHVFRKQMGHQAKTLYKLNTASMNNDHMGKKQKGFVLHVQERDDQMVDDVRDLNKSRLHWTTQLHHQFLAAVNALGLDKALPKKILEIMRVQHLTREQVASHLQKYRLQLRKSSSYVPVESVESPTFDASEETQQEFMVVPQAEPPNLTPSLEQTKSMVVESYCTDAGKSSSGSRCTADDMNNCFDHGSFHELCLPLTKQAFESGPCL